MKCNMWGQHLILDLSGCNIAKISDGPNILEWVKKLVPAIDMVSYGEPILEHFATQKDETAGYSLIQLIETSNIAAHFAEKLGQVYIDVFSCKEFDEQVAIDICKEFFEPANVNVKNFERGDFFEERLQGTREYVTMPIDEILFEGQTPHQMLAVYRNTEFGRFLVLDNEIQATEQDEFMYHEMLAHVPLLSHPNPERVLVVGGGDGGLLREALRHPSVKHIDIVEIDQDVVSVSKRLLPFLNTSADGKSVFDDPRVKLTIADASEHIKTNASKYDVIIVDSTDPIGPAKPLFGAEFFKNCEKVLNEGGILVTQNGTLSNKKTENVEAISNMRASNLNAGCYLVTVPSYYGGAVILGYAVKGQAFTLPTLAQLQKRYQEATLTTQHYTPAVHLAAFALPTWVKQKLNAMTPDDVKIAA